jgi:predicted esterase
MTIDNPTKRYCSSPVAKEERLNLIQRRSCLDSSLPEVSTPVSTPKVHVGFDRKLPSELLHQPPRYAHWQQKAPNQGGSGSVGPGIDLLNKTTGCVHCQQSAPNQGGCGRVSAGTDAGLEAVLMSAKTQGKTALCIWFHYLGGKGADWEHGLKAKIASQLPWVEWYFPDAPMRPVTNYRGATERCWFDQLEGQVTESMATPGLEVSVSMVHALLRQAEAHGFPSNRIFLGGMSQGGVLAMAAGFSHEKPLAGIMAMSAWVPPCLPRAIRQPSTPLMIGSGDRDDVIPLTTFHKGAKTLEQAGCSQIRTRVYPGLDHRWSDQGCQDVKQFIQSLASNTQVSAGRCSDAALPRWSK